MSKKSTAAATAAAEPVEQTAEQPAEEPQQQPQAKPRRQLRVVMSQQPEPELEQVEAQLAAVEAATPQPQPEDAGLRRCASHHKYFGDEAALRPVAEFPLHQGRLSSYCKRCNNLQHVEYARRKRVESKGLAERLAEAEAEIERLRARIAELTDGAE